MGRTMVVCLEKEKMRWYFVFWCIVYLGITLLASLPDVGGMKGSGGNRLVPAVRPAINTAHHSSPQRLFWRRSAIGSCNVIALDHS